MKVWSPIATVAAAAARLASRPRTLANLTVGVLDNSKPNADVLLHRVAELLVERTGAAGVRTWRKPGSSRAAGMLDEVAAAAHVVLTGSAD